MSKIYLAAQIISIAAFLFYGSSCILSKKMVNEFRRYQLERYRVLTGVLQLLGALGLWLGFFVPYLTTFASAGLALQMLLGVFIRIRIKDSLIQAAPAFLFFLLNAFIFLVHVKNWG